MSGVQTEPRDHSAAVLSGTADAAGATILVVEDEGFVREVTCEILQSCGYQVLKAANAKQATQLFQRYGRQIQLLLTDVVLPGQNGRELARRCKAVHPYLRTLFISGYPDNIVARDGTREPDMFYLAKPFSVRILIDRVSQILGTGRIKISGRRRQRTC